MRGVSRSLVSGVLVVFAAVALAPPMARADENDLLEYCLDNPDACALSVEAVDEGWQRHWNADRPQSLASTFKVLVLLAYAQAVADGTMSADDTVDKNEWARYFSGGSTLSTSWNELGNPDDVRLDDLARMMILNSDNSAPDLLLAELGKKRVKQAVKLFDWHDLPAAISAIFGLWGNLGGVGGTGNRVAADYGGFDVNGYQKELASHTKSLQKASFVERVRESLCDQPPWIAGPAPCDPPRPFTSEESLRILETHHFNRSTTRSYLNLMRRILDGSLLSPEAQQAVVRNLDEAWLERFPSLSPAFVRYGLKGGNLATGDGNQVLTWAHYMETSAGRYVVVVFLRDMLSTQQAPGAPDVNAFAQQFALDAAFRRQVRDAFSAEALAAELVPQLKKVKLQGGRTVTVKAKVFNTSPVSAGRPVTASLYVVDAAQPGGAAAVASARVKTLAGYKSKTVTLKATVDGARGKFAVVLVDSGEEVGEQDEANNLIWQRLD